MAIGGSNITSELDKHEQRITVFPWNVCVLKVVALLEAVLTSHLFNHDNNNDNNNNLYCCCYCCCCWRVTNH